jgi:EpsI family protein
MNRAWIKSLALASVMVASAIGAKVLTPTVHLAQTSAALVLEQAVPASFGDWREERDLGAAVINPETARVLKQIYSQTLSRTYINSKGERIMLSIAYGGDQTDTMQVHYPEVCYPAQGFMLLSIAPDVLRTAQRALPVKRLETNLSNQRFEPVTYWTTVGQAVVTGGMRKKLVEMRYGLLEGIIPDGLLFRVSSISTDTAQAYRLHDRFVRDLEPHLAPAVAARLMGAAE